MKKCLTIAGSDSGGCAGIQADIKAMSACGVFAMTAITAVTSQNTMGVTHVEGLSPLSVETQIEAVLDDIGADAVKSGMLFSRDIVERVAFVLKKYGVEKYVLDPVMVATSGAKLLNDDAVHGLKNKLIPMSLIITPNVPEAAALAGIEIVTENDVKTACKTIAQMGAKNVLIKGGHFDGEKADDILFDGVDFHRFSKERLATKNIHGSGCSYASAIAAYLAKGERVAEAVRQAKDYIHNAIEAGVALGIGKGSGPLHHFHKYYGKGL